MGRMGGRESDGNVEGECVYSVENSADFAAWMAGEAGCGRDSSENSCLACRERTALANRQTLRGWHTRYYLSRKSEFRVKTG